jgi:hypothetical protein
MSPALLGKYLDAARQVASHMVLLPRGITFAPFPVTAETDLDKFCVNRIIDFYQSQPTDLADYFHAAWKYRHRDSLGMPDATLDDIARSSSISGKYLGIVWAALTDDASADESVGPIAALRILWNELPGPVENAADANSDDSDADVKARCEAIRDFVVGVRERLAPKVANLTAPSVGDGAQPLVIWKNDQMAANRRRYVGGALVPELAPLPPGSPAAAAMVAPDGLDEAASFEATFHRFCDVFPDTFVVTERARVFLDPESEKSLTGRWLSAGFHNQMGYYRDDRPLCDLILDDASRARLDSLWEEFYFAASIPFRQYSSFIWFERAESGFIVDDQFNFARAEDKDCTSPEKVSRLREVYLEKARKVGASEVAMAAMDDYFDSMTAMFRHYERLAVESQSHHLEAVLRLAEKAYRRPLTDDENADLIDFYRFLREDDGLDHAAAIGDLVVSILASPNFCYRIDFTEPVGIAADGNGTPTASADSARSSIAPLTDTALANRLSYFLWSTMPDDELMGLAKAGRLRQPDVMRAQARRMLADPKVAALATEFGGNWLDFRRFEEHNAVDRDRFPTFDNELRRAMFEEPIRFMIDLFSNDGPVTDFLEGRHTFVNPVLAKHYGLDLPSRSDEWVRVDDATVVGRGGILPMAVFLTKNAPGLRTSPVKRGYWVAKRVLGDPIPAPPADVPDLPNDEAALGELTLREALAAHREHKSCATCHQRFDSLGLVFEGYGPIGERRGIDLGGREVETSAVFPDGSEGDGLGGLLRYIADQRREDFLASFCRNLLAYSLGRSLLLSDEPTVDRMLTSLAENDYRFASAIDIIVTSPQFLQKQFP